MSIEVARTSQNPLVLSDDRLRPGGATVSYRKVEAPEPMIKLRRQGLLNSEIAARLGVTERIVATDLYRAKQDGKDVPPSPYRRRAR